jgi:hypothetical protein
MLMPTQTKDQPQPGAPQPWSLKAENKALLYFVQLIHSMLNFGSPEQYRVVSLDTFHRLKEIEKAWDEIRDMERRANSIAPMINELIFYISRDPNIRISYSAELESALPRLKAFTDRPQEAIEAVRFMTNRIMEGYYNKCCAYINEFVVGDGKRKRECRIVAENFCSYLLNYGYQPHVVFSYINEQFFKRDIQGDAPRELSSFLRNFTFRPTPFRVLVSVSEDLSKVLSGRDDFTSHKNIVPPEFKGKFGFWGDQGFPPQHLFEMRLEALDRIDARNKVVEELSIIRGVTYSFAPSAEMEWHSQVVILHPNGYSSPVGDGVDVIKRARWRSAHPTREHGRRLKLFLDRFSGERDRSRLRNAISSYAAAFHADDLPAQLVSLWASLEGLLPAPPGKSTSGIEHFSRFVGACHRKMYWPSRLEDVYQQLRRAGYGDEVDGSLQGVAGPNGSAELRLASACLLAENHRVMKKIGESCAENPLALHRLFEIFKTAHPRGVDEDKANGDEARGDKANEEGADGEKADKKLPSCKGIFDCARDAETKVVWQLRRIYRERNRIVHRASPSANVEELVLSLNAYILTVIEAVIAQVEESPPSGLDQIFADIRISEEAREIAASKKEVANRPPTGADFPLLLGMKGA